MSGAGEHSAFRAAAINAEATAAGAIDNEAVLALIPSGEPMTPADAVAALKAAKPHLFRPKLSRDMTQAEYDAALQKVGVAPRTVRRHRL